MPIAHKSSITPEVAYIVWSITETEDELLQHLNLNDEEFDDLNTVKAPSKRLEWLGARTALKHLVNEHGQFYIYKDEFGKPHLKETSIGISMSHARGFGAAAINLKGEVGIDIETERAQIHRIAHKFLHPSEEAWAKGHGEKLTKIWSAKEALYKLHGRTQLTFAEQLIVSDFSNDNQVIGQILENGITEDYKLIYDHLSPIHLCCAY
ncbi:4'-phosphopantetheinyl transferase superfamily protein [Roseivirga sp. E12]|uniref:4'-phosphopantetheinyl transferase family protein n=1 Tax=Roseivirga sp. E12 TaxID=2819237 RepID=UPI001ABCF0C4|nr:4'-phosphopantetheinyl transferase superfamily protein [Roseivirga sp. E12]MBO3700037.1 4'-phosphopantetheinyl transferase superfamily protein [Roseivirga sp. E12]